MKLIEDITGIGGGFWDKVLLYRVAKEKKMWSVDCKDNKKFKGWFTDSATSFDGSLLDMSKLYLVENEYANAVGEEIVPLELEEIVMLYYDTKKSLGFCKVLPSTSHTTIPELHPKIFDCVFHSKREYIGKISDFDKTEEFSSRKIDRAEFYCTIFESNLKAGRIFKNIVKFMPETAPLIRKFGSDADILYDLC